MGAQVNKFWKEDGSENLWQKGNHTLRFYLASSWAVIINATSIMPSSRSVSSTEYAKQPDLKDPENMNRDMTKPTKWLCAQQWHSDQPGHPPSLIRVFAVRLMGS